MANRREYIRGVMYDTAKNLLVENDLQVNGTATFNGPVEFNSWSIDGVAPEEIIYGLSDLPCTLTVVHDGGTLYAEVEASGGGDIIYNINGTHLTLNCTTGSGTGGKARVALTAGTQASPHINYIYAIQSGANAVLAASTTVPTGEFAWVGQVVVQDVSTFLAQGPMLIHANIESTSSNDRGKISHMAEKLRALGIRWSSGIEPTTNITTNAGSADNVHLEVTEGEIYNLHRHTFPAKTTGPYYWGNGISATLYSEETDLNAFLSTTDGTSMSGLYFNLVVWGVSSSDTSDSKIFVNVPRDTYHNASNAQADVDNTADYTVPLDLQPSAFLIARICLRHQTSDNGTWTEVATYDLRGTPINSRTGGISSATASNEFVDNLFRIYDDADATKHAAFELSSITTGTTRTLTVPDQNGTILVDDGSTAITVGAPTTFSSNATFNSNTTFSADLIFTDTGTTQLHQNAGHLHLRTSGASKYIWLDSADDIYLDAAGDFWWRDASNQNLMTLTQAGALTVQTGRIYIGTQGTSQGIVNAYGDATTNGGILRLYNGDTENGTIAYWDFRAEGNIATLGPDTDTDLMVFAGTYMQCRGTNAFFGIDESVQCVGQFYGNATTAGGEVRWHQAGSENGTYQYFRGFANGDYWAFGNNVDAVTHFFYGDGRFVADGNGTFNGGEAIVNSSTTAGLQLNRNGNNYFYLRTHGTADEISLFCYDPDDGSYQGKAFTAYNLSLKTRFHGVAEFEDTVDLIGSTASNVLKSSTGKLNLQTTTGGKNIEITTGSNAALIMDCGGNFTWRDRDGGYATRMTLNSATGELTGTGELSGWGPITALDIHNNGGTGGASDESIASGTYTPTITNVVNYSSGSGIKGHWKRAGNIVEVSVYINVTHVSTATLTVFNMSLPVSSNLVAASDLIGNCSYTAGGVAGGGTVATNTALDTALCYYTSGSTATHEVRFHFTYEVL